MITDAKKHFVNRKKNESKIEREKERDNTCHLSWVIIAIIIGGEILIVRGIRPSQDVPLDVAGRLLGCEVLGADLVNPDGKSEIKCKMK